MNNELYHYGTPQSYDGDPNGSGRYRQGSGANPYQHEVSIRSTALKLQKEGMTEKEVAKYLGMSVDQLRQRKSIEKHEEDAARDALIFKLKNEGWSHVAIGERVGKSEAYVRNRLKQSTQDNAKKTDNVAIILKDAVDKNRFIDIGEGSQTMLGVSRTRFNTAVQKLKDEEGYKTWIEKVTQAGTGKQTVIKVLGQPDTTWSEMHANRDKIGFVVDHYLENDGKTVRGIEPPASVSSDRIKVRYAEEGGIDKDGVIEIRRGVKDLSLGENHYAQVRIAVDGTHYLKGMAIYSDDLPKGVDILFNTNKHLGTPMMGPKDNTVLKNLKADKENPFGTTLRMEEGVIAGQSHYIDDDGTEKLSPINIVRQEGDWKIWSKTLASQFLSKQPKALIKQQLDLSYDQKEEEFEELISLTNPEVKVKLLNSFADDCDASASHLKAAALPRQSSKVILPLIDIPDDEIYAPTYKNGEQVILIRYPHGGKFEIPTLTVNNNNPEGRRVLGGNTIDAVGISSAVAERLSGADFDGDTVTVIPIIGQKINTDDPLPGLVGFDPKESYRGYPGMKVKIDTQMEMGKISNLITDMTIKGAKSDELARAVRHSMVVIDAEKHNLNYKQSYIDNGIKDLKIKYQGGAQKGASTLISRASAQYHQYTRVEKTSPTLRTAEDQKWLDEHPDVTVLSNEDKKTFNRLSNRMTPQELEDYKAGKKIYRYTGEHKLKAIRDENGKVVRYEDTGTLKTFKSNQMKEHENAYELSSGTPQESLYADYANKLKVLANEARKEARTTEPTKRNPQAAEIYKSEVESLNKKLDDALLNKPLERKAQLLTSVYLSAAKKDNPHMTDDEEKKLKTQYLASFRARVGASKSLTSINITDKEWEAIQSKAISSTKLQQILENTDTDKVRKLATPRAESVVTDKEVNTIRNMVANGYTIAEIADSVGLSTSTVSKYVKGV